MRFGLPLREIGVDECTVNQQLRAFSFDLHYITLTIVVQQQE